MVLDTFPNINDSMGPRKFSSKPHELLPDSQNDLKSSTFPSSPDFRRIPPFPCFCLFLSWWLLIFPSHFLMSEWAHVLWHFAAFPGAEHGHAQPKGATHWAANSPTQLSWEKSCWGLQNKDSNKIKAGQPQQNLLADWSLFQGEKINSLNSS